MLDHQQASSSDTLTCVASGLLKLGFSIRWADLKKYPDGYDGDTYSFYVLPYMYPKARQIRDFHDIKKEIGVLLNTPMIRDKSMSNLRTVELHNSNKLPIDAKRSSDLGLIQCSKQRFIPEYVLIAAPGLPHDPYSTTFEWAKERYDHLFSVVSCRVLVRLHPLDPTKKDKKWRELPLDDQKDAGISVSKCHFLITSASSIALEAFTRGIPVVCDEHAPYKNACYLRIEDAAKHNQSKDIQKVLDDIANTQWSPGEICDGMPFLRYMNYGAI